MSKRAELKQWLKDTAIEIRKARADYRKYWSENGPIHSTYSGGKWDTMIGKLWYLDKVRREYRLRHIAYSQMRGKTRDQIEPYSESPLYKSDEEHIEWVMEEYRDEPIIFVDS